MAPPDLSCPQQGTSPRQILKLHPFALYRQQGLAPWAWSHLRSCGAGSRQEEAVFSLWERAAQGPLTHTSTARRFARREECLCDQNPPLTRPQMASTPGLTRGSSQVSWRPASSSHLQGHGAFPFMAIQGAGQPPH